MGAGAKLVQYRKQMTKPGEFGEFVRECRETKKLDLSQVQIGEVAKEAFGDAFGTRLEQWSRRQEWVTEATEATDASAFRDVINTMAVATMEEGYQQKTSEVLKLIGKYETPNQPEGEHTIHFKQSAVGDVKAVAPATEYPRAGFGGYKIQIPEPTKYGLVACLTVETVKSNNTRQFLKENLDVGRAVGTHQLKSALRVITGVANNYKRNGTTFNTYLTSGAWVNAVDDFDITKGPAEFDRLNQTFDRMVHPVIGEPIDVEPNSILAVGQQLFQLRSIMKATEIRVVNGSTTTVGANPLYDMSLTMSQDTFLRKMLIEELGLTAQQADTTFFYGDMPEAFKLREIEPFRVFETNDNSDIAFFQDIVYAVKGRWWGSFFVNDPMRVLRVRKMA